MTKRLLVNGEDRMSTAASIRDLLVELGLGSEPRGIAVALDGQVVPRSAWDSTAPAEGGAVEIVGAVQGG